MHANGNQIMEGKVLDEQVKIRIFEAFRQSCFLFDETSGQCAYMEMVQKMIDQQVDYITTDYPLETEKLIRKNGGDS